MLRKLKDKLLGKVPPGKARSPHWPKVRAEWLKDHPACAVCGGTKHLDVHHMHPFHLRPELELSLVNLISLCENDRDGINCHLFIGHLGNFKAFNPDVEKDAAAWREKIAKRPIA